MIQSMLAGMCLLFVSATVSAQPPASQPPRKPGMDFGKLLMDGLKKTKGCYGVEAAKTISGKNVIFAWFENREAVIRFYNSPVHKRMLAMSGGGSDKPLAHIKKGVPVLVIAAITFSKKPEIEGFPLPVKQISIEMYTPLPGGAQMNGKFSPASFKIPHLKGEPAKKKKTKE